VAGVPLIVGGELGGGEPGGGELTGGALPAPELPEPPAEAELPEPACDAAAPAEDVPEDDDAALGVKAAVVTEDDALAAQGCSAVPAAPVSEEPDPPAPHALNAAMRRVQSAIRESACAQRPVSAAIVPPVAAEQGRMASSPAESDEWQDSGRQRASEYARRQPRYLEIASRDRRLCVPASRRVCLEASGARAPLSRR